MIDLATARRILKYFAAPSSEQEFRQQLCSFPVLLDESVREELREALRAEKPLLAALDRADEVAPRIVARKVPYILGAGPLEQLLAKLQRGDFALEDVLEIARGPNVVQHLVPVYVRVISDYADKLAHEKQWRQALPLLRLLRAGLEASEASEQKQRNLDLAESAMVEAVIWSLVEVPDRRLLEEAEQCGLRVVARTDPSMEDHGLALQRLGVLYLDPFVKFRDLRNYRAAYDLWHEAFPREYGASASRVAPRDWHMPPLEEALGKAQDYLRRAAAARSGALRGRSLKALAEALMADALRADKPAPTEAIEAAREALGLLDPDDDRDHILTLEGLLDRAGASSAGKRAGAGTAADPGALPEEKRAAFIFEAAMRLRTEDPRGALEMLRDAREVFNRHGYPQQRQHRLDLMASLVRPAFAPAEDPSGWPGKWSDRMRALGAKASSGALSGRTLAACAVALALLSRAEDAEQQALGLVSAAVEADSAFAEEYDEVLRYVTYSLYVGTGANNFAAGNFPLAATAYLAALGVSLSLQLADSALDMIERVNDVLKRPGQQGLPDSALELLASNWLECERQLGETGAVRLSEAAALLDRCVASGSPEDFKDAWLLWQVAKGLRFANSLVPAESASDEEAGLLEEIRALEHDTPPQEQVQDLDEERFLVSWLRPKASGQGLGAGMWLANLQHVFDATREQRLASGPGEPMFVAVDEAMELAGKDTALVPLLLGQTAEGKLAVRWLFLFEGHGYMHRIGQPVAPSPMLLEQDGFELVVPPLGPVVGRVREAIRAEPGFQPLSDEAAQVVEGCEEGMLGNLRKHLEANPQIKHVCFWPHGPLHSMPLHLLGPVGASLSERAVVTYVPSLALLKRERRPLGEGLLSVGLGFGGSHPRDLAPLAGAVDEAAEIAGLFGGKALAENEATPSRLLEELPHHRYIHVATHGAQNAVAPAFHHLFFTPGPDGEDRLFAHDIDGLDLSGVDLMTLSACESALGRMDPSDNLRGLAASLFRAGVRTLVGTLWPTGTKACRTFFVALYRELHAGASKREAFAAAQRETRARFPQYRAWGAFYMTGDWR